MERFVQALQSFGIGRLGAIVGVSAAVAASLFILVFKIGGQPDGFLYGDMDLKEAASVTAALDQANINYKVSSDGTTIMVPRDIVAKTRLMLSDKGLPTSASVGYELFDQNNPLGQTDLVQKINRQRAMEGELGRTLMAMNGVTFAKVTLQLPQRQLFEDAASPPTAAVVIGSGRQLSAEQVRSVQNLITAAVPNMKPDSVAVIDQNSGKTLAGGGDGEGATGALAEERRSQAEQSLQRKIKELVEGVVGVGKAKVQVTAELDLSRVTTQNENWDPDGQVALSTSSVTNEEQEGQADEAGGAVSTSENLPGAAGAGGSDSSSNRNRSEETTNYVVSKTVRTEITEPGSIKRLAVAVALDGVSEPIRAQIEDLVRSSVGLVDTPERRDTLIVTSMKFAGGAAAPAGAAESKSMLAAFDKNDIMRAGELGILLVVAALIIFFVVRPLLKAAQGGGGGLMPMPMLAQGGGQSFGGGPTAGQIAYDPQNAQAMQISGPTEDPRIDMARIEGQVRTSSVKQVSDFVDRHPEESVSILRSWLHEA